MILPRLLRVQLYLLFISLLFSWLLLSNFAWAEEVMDDEFRFAKANEIIGAQHVYRLGVDGSSVLIAIADTGVFPESRLPLVELKGKVQKQYDYYNYGGDPTVYPGWEYIHGHMMATVAAGARNGYGGQGIAYGSQLNSYKISSARSIVPRGAFNVAAMLWRVRYDKAAVMSGAWGWFVRDHPSNINAEFIRWYFGPVAQQIALMEPNDLTGYRGTALVFAAGNNSMPNPANYMALLPYWFPELQSKIITAVALDVSRWESGDPLTHLRLASYSAQCGVAKDWCVAAPAQGVQFKWPNGEVRTTGGTSAATAVTVGSIALLMDAFPEISAEDAIAIILETATDLGKPGVDSIFGHGLINLEAAFQPVGALSFSGDGTTVSAAGSGYGYSPLLGQGFSDLLEETPIVYQDKYGRFFEGGSTLIANNDGIEPMALPSGGGADTKINAIAPGLGLTASGGVLWSNQDQSLSFVTGRRSDRAIVPNGVLPFDHMGRDAVVSMMTNKAWDANAKSRWFVGVVGTEKMPLAFGTWRYALDENVSFQTGLMAEQGKLYGTQGRGAFAFKGQTLTQWAGLAGAWNLGEKTTLTADMQAGYLSYRHDTPLGLTKLSGVMAKAGATLASYDVFMGGDQFQLFAGVPAIMLNAEAELKMPDRGFARSQSVQFNNRPEVEVKAAWRLRF